MSRILVLADLHCRSVWKDIVAKEDCDKIVFLGDYTVPREVKLDDPTDACGFLYEVLDFKDKNPDKVVLLRGNHDLFSLGYHWAECTPRDHPKVERYWHTKDVKNWFLKNTQWIYQIPNTNIICSHAGISKQFLDNVLEVLNNKGIKYYTGYPVPIDWIIDHINDIEPCELFGFTPCKFSDYSGDSATQPCTWIRPYSLLEYGIKNKVHVVGHTPVEHICNLKKEYLKANNSDFPIEECADIWLCDCLANKEYLIIEDTTEKTYEIKPCKL